MISRKIALEIKVSNNVRFFSQQVNFIHKVVLKNSTYIYVKHQFPKLAKSTQNPKSGPIIIKSEARDDIYNFFLLENFQYMTSREIGCYFCTTFSSLYPIVQSKKKHLALPTTSSSSSTTNNIASTQWFFPSKKVQIY